MSEVDHDRGAFARFLRSWQLPAVVGLLIVAGVAWWALPRRVEQIVPVDGSARWDADHAPPQRSVVWKPAQEIEGLLPGQAEGAEGLATPRLADHGTALYFTRRDSTGQSDIFRARLIDGTWAAGEPVADLNTPHDELGPNLSRDGKQLYFYSDRPSGEGGYDLYVATRTENGWSAPRNLGPEINSSANEYDPALSPDGATLFFASNRVADIEPAIDRDERLRRWKTTLRARLPASAFGLYMVRRDGPDDAWQACVPIAELNRPDSNEGAPFVSPNGAFLYFASDRAARAGERPNLDLYRTRWAQDRFGEPENLGSSVNTAAHETEPALSPEGFTLVFSSNRAGRDRLYVSGAEEVVAVSHWESPDLGAAGQYWWLLLLLTLALAALFAGLWYLRGRLPRTAQSARFFLGSVMLHLLVIFLLALWTFPQVVQVLISDATDVVPVPMLQGEADHQSHEDGREAYEKVDDALALEQSPVLPQLRRETEPQSVPRRTESRLPTVPTRIARELPREKVLPVPLPSEAPRQPELRELARRPSLPEPQVRELPELPEPAPAIADRQPEDPRLPVPQDVPVTRRQPANARELPSSQPAPVLPRPRPKFQPARIAEAEQPELPSPTRRLGSPPTPRSRPVDAPQLAEVVEALPEPFAATSAMDSEPVRPSPSPVEVARSESTRAPDVRPAPSDVSEAPPLRKPQPVSVLPERLLTVEAERAPAALREPSELVRRTAAPPDAAREVAAADTPELAAPQESPGGPVRPTVRPVELAKVEQGVSNQPRIADSAATESTSRIEPQPVEIAKVEPNESPEPIRTRIDISRRTPRTDRAPRVADIAEQPEAASEVALSATEESAPALLAPRVVSIGRSDSDVPAAPESLDAPGRTDRLRARPAPSRLTAAAGLSTDVSRATSAVASPLAKRSPRAAERTLARLGEDIDSASEPTASTPAERPIDGAVVQLDRTADRPLPETVRAPEDLTGPVTRDRHRLVLGALADERLDAPPSLGPAVSRLDRRRARAPRVAFAEDEIGTEALQFMRRGETRKLFLEKAGGDEETVEAVRRGLKWLAEHQNEDGSWSLHAFHKNCDGKHENCTHAGTEHSDTAGTGFALLPFLTEGHTHRDGPYKETVAKGLDWLIEHQKENGDLFVPGNSQNWMYSHAVGAIALCEGYAMSRGAGGSDIEKHRRAAQKSLDFIAEAQHKTMGGWRYRPGEEGDTSVVGWQVMALWFGRKAGLEVADETLERVHTWLRHVEHNQPVGGLFSYQRGRAPTPAMTSEALLSLQFIGADRDDPRLIAGADYLVKHLPDKNQHDTSYSWYYTTQALYHMSGDYWETWNPRMKELLKETQTRDGRMKGTWTPIDQWEKRGGRIFSTAMKLLILQVYYRHQPLYGHVEE
ncbi:MAG: hypothetical protein WD066_19180 [Planctomycetaceae bacterium]